MPSEADFRTFEALVRDGKYDTEVINRHWPAEADQKAYRAWCDARRSRRMAFWKAAFTHHDFVHQVDSMDFASDRDEEKLMAMLLRSVPSAVPLGNDAHGTLYRLVPDSSAVIPDCDYEDESAYYSDDEVAPTPMQQQQRRSLSTLGLNIRSASSSDYAHGFHFRQLGILESSTPDNGGGYTWSQTGFNLVARLSPKNRGGGPATAFCAVFNTHPYHSVDEERYETTNKIGYLPLQDGAMSCSFATLGGIAGLADCAEDFSTALSWGEPSWAEQVEIVPAEREVDGYIVGVEAVAGVGE